MIIKSRSLCKTFVSGNVEIVDIQPGNGYSGIKPGK